MSDTDPAPHAQPHGDACQVCPICLLIGGAGGVSPEVRQHLRAAGRELALALRAALDGLAPEQEDGAPQGGLRRVDLEDP